MSDRCYVSLTCRKADADRLNELFDESWNLTFDEDGLVRMSGSECDYGLLEERKAASAAGIPWIGYNGSGSNYGPASFACDGTKEMEISCNEDGDLYVVVLDNGSIDDEALTAAREFLKFRDGVKKLLEEFEIPTDKLPARAKSAVITGYWVVTDDESPDDSGRLPILGRFESEEDAASFIEYMPDKAKVDRGGFGLVGPENNSNNRGLNRKK